MRLDEIKRIPERSCFSDAGIGIGKEPNIDFIGVKPTAILGNLI